MKSWKQKISYFSLFLILFCTVLAVKIEHTQAASGYQIDYRQIGLEVGDTSWNSLGKTSGSLFKKLKSKKIKWYSTNKKIVKITHKNYRCDYKALRPGICYICAKYKGKTYKCKVVVFNSQKSNVKKLKIDMKGCLNNSEYYSYGCRVYNPNNFAVKTRLYAEVKTKQRVEITDDRYEFKIPAKGYRYIANNQYNTYSSELDSGSVVVTYKFTTKKPTPASVDAFDIYNIFTPAKKVMKVSNLSIRKRTPEKKGYKKDYYDVKYTIKNKSRKVLRYSTTEIILIKNKKVVGVVFHENRFRIGSKAKSSESDGFKWPFKRWTREVVVNRYNY